MARSSSYNLAAQRRKRRAEHLRASKSLGYHAGQIGRRQAVGRGDRGPLAGAVGTRQARASGDPGHGWHSWTKPQVGSARSRRCGAHAHGQGILERWRRRRRWGGGPLTSPQPAPQSPLPAISQLPPPASLVAWRKTGKCDGLSLFLTVSGALACACLSPLREGFVRHLGWIRG